jgi:hypothetical protein
MQTVTTIGLDIAKSTALMAVAKWPCPAEAALRLDFLRDASAMPGRHRSLRLVASLVARTPSAWPHRSTNAAGLLEALCEAA